MNKNVYDPVEDYLKTLTTILDNVVESIPLYIPANDEDEKILKIGLDMLETMEQDIESGNIRELNDIIDFKEVRRCWKEDSYSVNDIIQNCDTRTIIQDIVYHYGGE